MACGTNLALHLSLWVKFVWNTATFILLCITYAAFTLQGQRWIVAMETTGPTKPKVFTTWPFIDKNFWPWSIGRGRREWVQRRGDQLGACQEPAEWGWRGGADTGDVKGAGLSDSVFGGGWKKGAHTPCFSLGWPGRGGIIHRERETGLKTRILTLVFNMLSLRILWNVWVEMSPKQ